ncbi:MAG: hypothetical protein COA49_03065 [Bacteroidetes bacterium]|nr:MAG: hypothetical protein COA49_03065 [Bacteroidota bacterium]
MEIMQEKDSRSIARIYLFSAFIFCSSIITGCFEDPRDSANIVAPSGIIAKDSFVLLLSDIQLIEAASKNRVWRNDDVKKRLGEAYLEVFEKYSVSKEEFETSHAWWWSHPVAMKSVLLEVTENLSQLEAER